jgi:hypothetical protein
MTNNRNPRNPLDGLVANDTFPAPSTLDLIPTARQMKRNAMTEERLAKRRESRAKFDKLYPVTSYYIPVHLHAPATEARKVVAALARQKNSTIGSVASGMVAWSLSYVDKGLLTIHGTPRADRNKMAIVMEDAQDAWSVGPVEIPELPKRIKARKMFLSFRFTSDIKAKIKSLSKGTLAEGEVLVRLLEYAINGYASGKGVIYTEAQEIKQAFKLIDAQEQDSWT